MPDLDLPGLRGETPTGLLAALGVVDIIAHSRRGSEPQLSWTDGVAPHAVLHSETADADALARLVLDDLEAWRTSELLRPRRNGALATDIKFTPQELRMWTRQVSERAAEHGRRAADLHRGLVAEGATAGTGDTKPTHLHFTTGNQQFLDVARTLAEHVTMEALLPALLGPWSYESSLKGFNWDSRGARIGAVSGFRPAREKLTAPGVNWLAFLGVSFFPVVEKAGAAETTGFRGSLKKASFIWPLWRRPATLPTVRALLSRRDLDPDGPRSLTVPQLRLLGVSSIRRCPIFRNEYGYGSFGPSSEVRST